MSAIARALSWPVVAYRRWISPALPARCRFYPSCSAYAVEALKVHGARVGVWLTVKRLVRCQPFHPGGFDPVPAASDQDERAQMTDTTGARR